MNRPISVVRPSSVHRSKSNLQRGMKETEMPPSLNTYKAIPQGSRNRTTSQDSPPPVVSQISSGKAISPNSRPRTNSQDNTANSPYDPVSKSTLSKANSTVAAMNTGTVSSQGPNRPTVTPISGSKPSSSAAPTSIVGDRAVFIGKNPLQYALWGHYLALGTALLSILLGIFEISMHWSDPWQCKIDGTLIDKKYLVDNFGTCTAFYQEGGVTKQMCCNESNEYIEIKGNYPVGLVMFFFGIITFIINDPDFGCSLWFPNDTVWYQCRVSVLGIIYVIIGMIGCGTWVTSLAGSLYITCGFIYIWASYRQESGDGGYFERKDATKAKAEEAERRIKEQKENPKKDTSNDYLLPDYADLIMNMTFSTACSNIYEFLYRAYNEDKLSTYFWLLVYVIANIYYYFDTVSIWYDTVNTLRNGMLDGTLDINCSEERCKLNRIAIQYGPISGFVPWAKGGGKCLNLNCSMILYPVTKILLSKLHSAGISFSSKVKSNSLFAKLFAHPISRYIPLQKNIEFHKFVGYMILLFTIIHILFHLLNLQYASTGTLHRIALWGWNYTYIFTGIIITYVMWILFAAAVPESIRRTKFEIFFNSHHLYIIFIGVLFLHGHVFWKWAIFPVFLLLVEKYLESNRGKVEFSVVKVEWIPPVMAIYFRPKNKEEFAFKEGQYLSLNCPFISTKEWHPFTISSAVDDLFNGPRINLESGEEVVAVPRPKDWGAGRSGNAKWNKFCDVSKDYRQIPPEELLDKSDTGYNDYVSVHIKVHGLEHPTARTWTRKLKEYFELLCPGKAFPYYFTRRDHRGDIILGREKGPDGAMPILCVDGPHSAPAEHYCSYGTVMLVGAGIGLTPCASILTALLKYRWKKNFPPEILHFYWVIRHNELDSFQWLVHLLTELSYDVKRAREMKQIEPNYYCEMNIYVTAGPKSAAAGPPPNNTVRLKRAAKVYSEAFSKPFFTAEQLYSALLFPTVESKGQIQKMKKNPKASNRLQDIWIWNGRPNWDNVFENMKAERQHGDIGVCFCGAPAIGSDLQKMCEKYSSVADDCLFTLHKENF